MSNKLMSWFHMNKFALKCAWQVFNLRRKSHMHQVNDLLSRSARLQSFEAPNKVFMDKWRQTTKAKTYKLKMDMAKEGIDYDEFIENQIQGS